MERRVSPIRFFLKIDLMGVELQAKGILGHMRNNFLVLFILLGLFVAVLSGLAEWVPLLSTFCASLTGGCADTARVTFLLVPIWIWGIFIYVALLLSMFRFSSWFSHLFAGALGVELTLVWIMISLKSYCVYCIANFIVIFAILLLSFRREDFWRSLSLCMIAFVASYFIIPHENKLYASPGNQVPRSDALAKVGDDVITEEDLGVVVGSRVLELEKEVYRVKREQLDQMLAERLFRKEAASEGISLDDYVSKKLAGMPVQVTEEEIEGYYQENLPRWKDWKGTQEELRGRIRSFLEQQRKYEELMKFAKSLEPAHGVVIYLKEPTMKVSRVNIDGNHSLGPPDAPVTVVEFSDYQCPACRSGHAVVLKVREAYQGKIRWVFKDFPLRMHKEAAFAAEAARCAGEQGKFWEYQDLLYGSREVFSKERLEQFAAGLGLNSASFGECLESGRQKANVEKDIAEARRIGVDRTPSFIINGRLATGVPALEEFKKMIQEELSRAEGKP